MARAKNALREHWIGIFDPKDPTKEPTQWERLAEGVFTVEDDSEDQVEEYSDYAGDGTLQEDITGITESFNFEGQYNQENPAMKMIADMKRKTGDGRKLWHKVIRPDHSSEIVGVATASNIVAGSGEASEYETFSCRLAFTAIPIERKPQEVPSL